MHVDVGVVAGENVPEGLGRMSRRASVQPGTVSMTHFASEDSTRFRKPSSALCRTSASGQAAMSRRVGMTNSLVCRVPVAEGPPASTVSKVSLVSPSDNLQLPVPKTNDFKVAVILHYLHVIQNE